MYIFVSDFDSTPVIILSNVHCQGGELFFTISLS